MQKDHSASGFDSIQEWIYHNVRDRILKNQLKEGSLISERDLSEQFHTSRTPVREALKRLEYDGLVEILPRRGVFVKTISFDTIFNIYEIRLGLDAVAARLCALRKTDAIVASLEKCMEEYIKADKEGDISRAAKYNMKFHREIAEGSRNPLLSNYENMLINQCYANIQLNAINLSNQKQSIAQHQQILKLIIEENALGAERAARDHVADGIAYLTSIRNQYYAIE